MDYKNILGISVNTDTNINAEKGYKLVDEKIDDKEWELFQITSVLVGIDTAWVRHYFWFRKIGK